MSFSPVLKVRKLLDKMKAERYSPRLKRFPSRTLSEEARDSTDNLMHIPAYKLRKTGNKQEITGVNHFSSLPDEATLYVFSFLDSRDLCHVAQLDKQMNVLSSDEMVWKALASFDWGISALFDDALSWKESYALLENLCSEGIWEGMSKWLEPEGFATEQKTTGRLHFLKRSHRAQGQSSPTRASPTAIHRVDSQTHSSPVPSPSRESSRPSTPTIPHPRDALNRIKGSGVTVNCEQPSPFKIEGQMLVHDDSGCTFEWNKQFDKHTSVYSGHMDYQKRTVTGTISYHDGGTHWKGIFSYTKIANRGSKLVLA